MDFLFLSFHPSSFCLDSPLWIWDSPLFRFLVAVPWGRGVLYLSAISSIISTFIRLHSLRSSDHFWALPALYVHLPAFTAVFVHFPSRHPPPLPRSVHCTTLSHICHRGSDIASLSVRWPPPGGMPDSNPGPLPLQSMEPPKEYIWGYGATWSHPSPSP